jgi:uncharacterized tellurite resistance protein B-like protein
VSLLRFLGLEREAPPAGPEAETATVRRIAAQLERLDPAVARRLAAFAYVLARVAHADLSFGEEETETMQRLVRETTELAHEEVELVVEIAKSQARLLGGTEDYVVTREFRRVSSRDERLKLLDCLFAVAAADGTISADESNEIMSIGEELGFTRTEVIAVRTRYREHLSELRSSQD